MEHGSPLEEIWRSELCCGCGACAAVCAQGVIKLGFSEGRGLYSARPLYEGKNCSGCGLCAQVCPMVSMGVEEANLSDSASLPVLANWLVGPYKRIYTGHASDKKLRYESSSGGVTTALLKHLFEGKAIEGALIVGDVSDMPLRHKTVLLRKVDEAAETRGTVYCQIDFSPAWGFIQSIASQMAIVGQPCQLRAVESFMAAKKLDVTKLLKIGLFCGGTTSHKALDYLCKRKRTNPRDVLSIRYRSGGWPGRRMLVRASDSSKAKEAKEVVLFEIEASTFQRYLYSFCFGGSLYPRCCQICRDQTAETADISLGDAWLPRFTSKDKLGTNIIISRTARAAKILKDAVANNIIQLEDAQPEDVIRSQGNCLVGRKLGLWGKHIRDSFSDDTALKLCERHISQYVPKRGQLLERRSFQWLAKHLPTGFVFGLFSSYNFMKGLTRGSLKFLARLPTCRAGGRNSSSYGKDLIQ